MFKTKITATIIFSAVILGTNLSSCSVEVDTHSHDHGHEQKSHQKHYTPGIGFFMGRIQTYHEKLGAAIEAKNTELIKFYIHEIEDTVEDIKELHPEKKESEIIGMVFTPIEAMENALEKKDFPEVKNGYVQLTHTCNTCHTAMDHGYIVIKVPTETKYTNQDFSGK